MSDTTALHPLAPDHIPYYIASPNQPDILFQIVVASVVAMVVLIGVFYFYLHALPDRMAHKASHAQLQLVGILALIGLFTHNNLFWIAALLLAALQFPDLTSPLRSIAESLERISSRSKIR